MNRLANDQLGPHSTPQWQRLRMQHLGRGGTGDAQRMHCGQPIDYAAKSNSTPGSYEIDLRLTIGSP